MKTKLLTGLVAVAMVCSLVQISSVKADTQENTVIAKLDYTYQDAGDVEVDESDATVSDLNVERYGDKTNGYRFTDGSAKLFASVTGSQNKTLEWTKNDNDEVSAEYTMGEAKEAEPVMAATKKNPWTENTVPYFEVQFSTANYENIAFSAYVGATKTGPKDYQLSYAVGDNETFTRLTEDTAKVELAKNKSMTKIAGTLPAEADNQENVRVRIEIVTLRTVNQDGATEDAPTLLTAKSNKGEAAINHISITGAPKEVVTPTPDPTQEPTPEPSQDPTQEPTKAPTATPEPTQASNTVAPTQNPPATPGNTSNSETKVTVKKLKLNKKNLKLKKGKSYQLKVSFQVIGASKAKIKSALKWSSSKKKIATVSKTGKIKAKKAGKTTITVKYKTQKATCTVTVKK